ncbi:hypothetical protein ACEQ8H_005330 [Pleosporales sp. CAS-2024a]
MSSGFISGGTVDKPTERDDEWRQAQAEIEAARKAKADLAAQHDGKSLFEILQENKDKKQAEFEKRARYQLHVSLNDEEADYLDSIDEKKRKAEAEVKKDTRERLEAFRRQQEEEARIALEKEGADGSLEEQVQWSAPPRKRKKDPESGLLKGVKLRKVNSTPAENDAKHESDVIAKAIPTLAPPECVTAKKVSIPAGRSTSVAASAKKPTNVISLGLGYASSEDDE